VETESGRKKKKWDSKDSGKKGEKDYPRIVKSTDRRKGEHHTSTSRKRDFVKGEGREVEMSCRKKEPP